MHLSGQANSERVRLFACHNKSVRRMKREVMLVSASQNIHDKSPILDCIFHLSIRLKKFGLPILTKLN